MARTALAQPGLLWQDFDQENSQAYRPTTTGGVVGETGIAGLTLGGAWDGWCASTVCHVTISSPRTW